MSNYSSSSDTAYRRIMDVQPSYDIGQQSYTPGVPGPPPHSGNWCNSPLFWLMFVLVLAAGTVGTVLAAISINKNNDQDVQLQLQNLKDMVLMMNASDAVSAIEVLQAKDMTLMQNVADLQTGLDAEEVARQSKDMILMQNVSDLDAALDAETAAREAKDATLMQNVSDLQAALAAEEAVRILKDMILMQNVTNLDAAIDAEEAARIAKDMVLMNNVTYLQQQIDALGMMEVENITMALAPIIADIMTLESDAFTHAVDGYGTLAIVSPTPSPSGVGRTLRVDLNLLGGPGVTITPSPSPAGPVTVGVTFPPTISGITGVEADSGGIAAGPTIDIAGGTGISTVRSLNQITIINDGITLVSADNDGGGSGASGPEIRFTGASGITTNRVGGEITISGAGLGGINGITADVGGTTTGSPVTLTGGPRVATTRSGDTITVAAEFTGLSADNDGGGGTTSGNTVILAGGTGVTTTRVGDTITIDAAPSGGGITDVTADVGGATTGSSLTLTGGTGVTTTRVGDTITIDASVASGITSVTADSGGAAPGPNVNLIGGLGVNTTRSGDDVSVGIDPPTAAPAICPLCQDTLDIDMEVHWCAVGWDDGLFDAAITYGTYIRYRKRERMISIDVFPPHPSTGCNFIGAGFGPGTFDFLLRGCQGGPVGELYLCEGANPGIDNYANTCGTITQLCCFNMVGGPCTCLTPIASGVPTMGYTLPATPPAERACKAPVLPEVDTPMFERSIGEGVITIVSGIVGYFTGFDPSPSTPTDYPQLTSTGFCGAGQCGIGGLNIVTNVVPAGGGGGGGGRR